MKKSVILVLTLLISLFTFKVDALDLKGASTYEIENYFIRVNVEKDGNAKVYEEIKVHYYANENTFVKKVPIKGSVVESDGNKYTFELELDNIKTPDNTIITSNDKEYSFATVNIDSVNNEVINYVYLYDIKFDNDFLRKFNMYLINPEWNTTIKNANFEINYPYSIDKNSIYLTTGSIYSNNTNNVKYEINGNTIKGKILYSLNNNESLVLRSKLSYSRFIKRDVVNKYIFPSIIVMILNVLAVFIMWKIYGKDYGKEEYVVNKVPQKYNPLEMFYITENCDYISDKSLKSLIVYLASIGYIKIERKFNLIKLKKVKEYKGDNELERIVMRRLFDTSSTITIEEDDELLYDSLMKVKRLLSNKENDYLLKERHSAWVTIVPTILGVINMFMAIGIILYGYSFSEILLTVVFGAIGFSILSFSTTINRGTGMVVCIAVALFMILLSGFNILFNLTSEYTYLLIYYVFAALTFSAIMLFIYIMPRRTKEGNTLYYKAIAFKNFLENPDSKVLKKMNEDYYSEIIPYAYAFDCEDKIIDAYLKIDKKPKTVKWFKDVKEK